MLRINRLAHRKLYMVIIICPSLPKVKLGHVGVGSNITLNHSFTHRKSYLIIICPNSHEKLNKIEIMSSLSRFMNLLRHCQVRVISCICANFVSVYPQILSTEKNASAWIYSHKITKNDKNRIYMCVYCITRYVFICMSSN